MARGRLKDNWDQCRRGGGKGACVFMSIKLRGLPISAYRSKVEHSYMRDGDAIVLENVPCEMTFESTNGFMEHESERHSYLPVFHLSGIIRDIRGKFPFNVSTVYFMDTDRQFITKDCVYYPTPDELVHMIKTGQYFTDRFALPDLMVHNTYSFPVLVNLTIIPPHNTAAYEQATFSGASNPDAAGIDKTNLPIFYVGFAGTGVTKKTDKLLDYYGINLDEDFDSYVLTAQAAGYTDPPLMDYIPEPEEQPENVVEQSEDYYISEEESKDLIRARQEEVQRTQEEKAAELQTAQEAEFQDDPESLILARADRDVAKRLQRKLQPESERENVKQEQAQEQKQASDDFIAVPEKKQQQSQAQAQAQAQSQMVQDLVQQVQAQQQAQDTPKPEVKEAGTVVTKASAERLARAREAVRKAEAERAAKRAAREGVQHVEAVEEARAVEEAVKEKAEAAADVIKAEPKAEPAKSAPASVFGAGDMITAPPEEPKNEAPDVPQQYKESQMDFNQERNEFIEQHREDVQAVKEAGLHADDVHTLRDQKGSDVQDATLQAKIDDAKALAAAQEAARNVQRDISQDGIIGEAKAPETQTPSEKAQSEVRPESRKMTHGEVVAARAAREAQRAEAVHRQVSQNLQDVADRDAAEKQGNNGLNEQQHS